MDIAFQELAFTCGYRHLFFSDLSNHFGVNYGFYVPEMLVKYSDPVDWDGSGLRWILGFRFNAHVRGLVFISFVWYFLLLGFWF